MLAAGNTAGTSLGFYCYIGDLQSCYNYLTFFFKPPHSLSASLTRAEPRSTGPGSGGPRWGSAGHRETASGAKPPPEAAVSAPTTPSPNRGRA